MYVCVSCTGNLRAGDIMILERDNAFGEVAAKQIGGGVVGFVTDRQPEGCVSRAFVENRIGNRRVIGRVAILNGNVALFVTESPVLNDVAPSFTSRRRYA